MKRVLLLTTVLSVALLWSTAAVAGPNDNLDVRFAVHAIDYPTGKTPPPSCGVGSPDPVETGVQCRDYNTVRATNEYPGPWVYVVAGQAGSVGIKGVSFGLNYIPGTGSGNGISSTILANSVTLCNDGLDFPSDSPQPVWPNPGSGIRITWASCQNTVVGADGVHAVVAQFYTYAYSADVFEVTPNQTLASGDELDVTDCSGATTKLLAITAPSLVPMLTGKVQYGKGRDGLIGYTPCNVLPAQETTWGALKTLYEGGE